MSKKKLWVAVGKPVSRIVTQVEWVSYLSLKELMLQWTAGDWSEDDEVHYQAALRQGCWAFVEERPIPVVHYWYKRTVPLSQVAMMLGHELGHASGKTARGVDKEEFRADEYGHVARLVFEHLTS